MAIGYEFGPGASLIDTLLQTPSAAGSVASNACRIAEKEREFTDSLEESKKYSSVIKFVLEDIRRTAEYSSDIAEAVINETVQDVISENVSP